jgi:hypothetical protein
VAPSYGSQGCRGRGTGGLSEVEGEAACGWEALSEGRGTWQAAAPVVLSPQRATGHGFKAPLLTPLIVFEIRADWNQWLTRVIGWRVGLGRFLSQFTVVTLLEVEKGCV